MESKITHWIPVIGLFIYFLEYYKLPYNEIKGFNASIFICKHFLLIVFITIIIAFIK